MSQTIQLMVILQIGKGLIHTIDNIISVQISILKLCRTHNVNSFICCCLQLLIWMLCQRISNCFDPLGEIRILKNEAIEFIIIRMFRIIRQSFKSSEGIRRCCISTPLCLFLLHHITSHTEVMHTIAGGSSFYTVIKRLPLIWDNFGSDQLLFTMPECIRYLHIL